VPPARHAHPHAVPESRLSYINCEEQEASAFETRLTVGVGSGFLRSGASTTASRRRLAPNEPSQCIVHSGAGGKDFRDLWLNKHEICARDGPRIVFPANTTVKVAGLVFPAQFIRIIAAFLHRNISPRWLRLVR
jgi:hypothetical protein